MFRSIKPFLPRSLFGRAALILILPIVMMQLIVSVAFVQRHIEGVTRQLVRGVLIDLSVLQASIDAQPDSARALDEVRQLSDLFQMQISLPAAVPEGQDLASLRAAGDLRSPFDLTGGAVLNALRRGLPELIMADLRSVSGDVILFVDTEHGPMSVELDRSRLSAQNPHQLFVILIVASVLMTLIAYVFLRNQLRPIKKMAMAAEAFGKGEVIPYRPRGATEVRAAGAAFLDMRARVERAIESRTLMLSGISHDLRTPITRLRLGLSMLPEDEEVEALLSDVKEMERLVDEFLAFARGDAMEEASLVDPAQIVQQIAENAARSGHQLILGLPAEGVQLRMRPQAVQRAVENLVGNGLRHGKQVALGIVVRDKTLRFVVEDDGPGIPEAERQTAIAPFARLDSARNPNKGGGVGLGLSIVADVARSHGGRLVLGKSDTLGGLRAELHLPR